MFCQCATVHSSNGKLATQIPPNPLNPVNRSCTNSRCNMVRLHPSCERQMCRRHCVEAGGCRGAKGHTTSSAPGPLATLTDKGKQRATSSSSTPRLGSSSPPPPWDISSNAIANKSTAVDMFANPRYACPFIECIHHNLPLLFFL